jgi:hypothetical protein
MNLHHQFKLPKALRNEWKALKFDGFFFFFFFLSFFLKSLGTLKTSCTKDPSP